MISMWSSKSWNVAPSLPSCVFDSLETAQPRLGELTYQMASFALPVFIKKVDAAQTVVRTILDNSKEVAKPSDVQHSYDDKYLLSEFIVNSAIQGISNCLSTMGLMDSDREKLSEWSKTRSVSLRWKSEDYWKVCFPSFYCVARIFFRTRLTIEITCLYVSWLAKSLEKCALIPHLSQILPGTRRSAIP